jgi:hypothetical protein
VPAPRETRPPAPGARGPARQTTAHDAAARRPTADPRGHETATEQPLPPPRAAATALVQAVLEILAGRRPVQQVRHLTTEAVYEELRRRLSAHRDLQKRGAGSEGAPRLQSVHVDVPTEGAAEVTAVIKLGARHRAVALRLDGAEGRWNCTALRLL